MDKPFSLKAAQESSQDSSISGSVWRSRFSVDGRMRFDNLA